MHVLKGDKIAFFDCDDTLIAWGTPKDDSGWSPISDRSTGYRYYMYGPHVEQLIQHKKRGHKIIVWSAGGVEWAEKVVKMLALVGYVDIVMAKPAWAYDDLNPEQYMPKSKFIKPDGGEAP